MLPRVFLCVEKSEPLVKRDSLNEFKSGVSFVNAQLTDRHKPPR